VEVRRAIRGGRGTGAEELDDSVDGGADTACLEAVDGVGGCGNDAQGSNEDAKSAFEQFGSEWYPMWRPSRCVL
jgi:hypothetical protein